MRSWVRDLAIVISAVATSLVVLCQENRSEDVLGNAVINLVRGRSHFDGPLYAVRLPSLGDDLLYLLKKQTSDRAITDLQPVDFYRVLPAAYEVRGGQMVSETVEIDGRHEWIVAMCHRGGKTFLLQGSPDPNSEFNDLAGYLALKIPDAGTAVEVFDFYLKVALGEEFRTRVVGDDLKLESVAPDDFRLRFPAKRRRAAFEQWWNDIPAEVKKKIGPPTALPTKAGYEVRYFLYTQGNVSVHNLAISRNGAVVETQSNTLVGDQGIASGVPTCAELSAAESKLKRRLR
jgi:hypothetical protein